MTMWFQIPQMLATEPDEELARMKAAYRAHYRKFERGPEQERIDARAMFALISAEQRRRLVSPVSAPRIL